MAELTAAGYTQLRTGSPINEWFVELRDDANEPVPIDDLDSGTVNRLSGDDPRVTVSDNAGTQTLTIAAELSSSDVDASVGDPVTIEGSVLFAAVSGGSPLSEVESFDPFTFSDAEDEATFRHEVELPEQT